MSEIETPMRLVKVERKCTNGLCGRGMMKPTGNVKSVVGKDAQPDQHEHKCDRCGRKQLFEHVYPYMKYVEGSE